MENEIARHNNRLLQTEDDRSPPPRCNCQAALKKDCPMPNYCTVQRVVYRALVTSGDLARPADQQTATYTGLTENRIKKRIKTHYSDIAKYNPKDPDNHKSGTRLSRHCGQLGLDGIPYNIEWSILSETGSAFNPVAEICQLFLMERYLIMFKRDNLASYALQFCKT